MRNRFFAPYLRLLDGTEAMTTRARVVTIAMIWGAVSTSLLVLDSQGVLRTWGTITLVVAALVGTAVVWRFRREVRKPDPSAEAVTARASLGEASA